jgi:hypothetical protein
VTQYKDASTYTADLQALRDNIQQHRAEAMTNLNELLLDQFRALGIKFEQATWDAQKNAEGKPKKRDLRLADIAALQPFHWGYEFDEVMNERGGFDAIITNPPWEIFKPNAKEFFAAFSDEITKKNMTIKEFEKEQAHLLRKPDIRDAWLSYQSQYPHQSLFFRSTEQYKNQISIVNGKKAGTDINLYKLFLEQCFNLLRSSGRCGIIIPSGIYTDLGTKQLREVLFSQTGVSTLFGLSNERFLFEGVDHRFKICLLAFEKGSQTQSFMAAFRITPRESIASNELDNFLHSPNQHIEIPVSLVRRLSPDSLSVMEFRSETDVKIAEKMLRWPLLGEDIEEKWKLSLTAEFHMTNDSYLFKTSLGKNRLSLYEGKMIHQFDHSFGTPRYWVDEKEGRAALTGRHEDTGQIFDYQTYRLGFRAIARTSDSRTIIVGPIPKGVFCGNSILVSSSKNTTKLSSNELVFAQAIFNSFIVDFYARQMVSANINMFYLYQLPVPRLTAADPAFAPIVERAAKLICTTPEFDDLAQAVGLGSHKNGVTNPVERAKLRAELDGLVAHAYGLAEGEFVHILSTFPLVPEPVKVAAHNAYRDLERGLIK